MSDSAQLLVSQLLTALATSVAAIMIARALEPDDWGVFSAFLGLSIALALVVDFGIGTWLLRELSTMLTHGGVEHDSQQVGRFMCSGVVLNCVIALPLILMAAIWTVTTRPGAGVSIALLSLLVYGALTAVANAIEAHPRARRKVRLVLSASLLEKGMLILMVLAVSAADAGVGAIGLGYVAAGLCRIAFDGFVVFARHGVPVVAPSRSSVLAQARASLPFALNAASLNLIPRLDTLVLITMSSTSAAWFAVGERALGPALLVPATLSIALYPFMASRATRQVAPWKLAGAFGLLGAVLAAGGIVLAPHLIPMLFGASYRDAVSVVQVMLLVVPLVYATSPLLVLAYSYGQERSLLKPGLALSFLGTLGIVMGQAAGGADLVAIGFVARSGLFLALVGTVAIVAWRRHGGSDTSDVSTSTRLTAQVP